MKRPDCVTGKDASEVLAGGCIVGAPLALAGAFWWAMKNAGKRQHDLAHEVEEVEIEERALGDASGAHLIPPEESLKRFMVSLRRVTEQYEKMNARFQKSAHDSEMAKLQNLKKRFEAQDGSLSAECQQMLTEAQQLLARYAPQ